MTEPAAPVTEDEVLAFVRGTIASVWELELLLLLYRSPERIWSAKEIDRELRASETVVSTGLARLRAAGLIVDEARDRSRYQPASSQVHKLVEALAIAYRTNPISMVKAILGAPDARLKIFSDAFRFKE